MDKTQWTLYLNTIEYNDLYFIQSVLEKVTPDPRIIKIEPVQGIFDQNTQKYMVNDSNFATYLPFLENSTRNVSAKNRVLLVKSNLFRLLKIRKATSARRRLKKI